MRLMKVFIGLSENRYFLFETINPFRRIAQADQLIDDVDVDLTYLGLPFERPSDELLVKLDQRQELLARVKSDDVVRYQLNEEGWIEGKIERFDEPCTLVGILYDIGANFWDPMAGDFQYKKYVGGLREMARRELEKRTKLHELGKSNHCDARIQLY